MNKTIDFSSILDRDLSYSHLGFIARIFNKSGGLKAIDIYGGGFSLSEIYKDLKKKYPKKNYSLTIEIK